MSVGRKIVIKLPRFDLSKTEDRLKLIILVIGLILVLGSMTLGGVAFTMRSEFCSSCHEMQPEYKTWEASAHSNVGCVDCHMEPGVVHIAKDKMAAMVQVYKHITKSYDSPIEYPVEHKGYLKDSQCLRCHSANRLYSPSGDIIIPHEKHSAQNIKCVQCHAGVAHGLVAERGVSSASNIPFAQWTATVAAEQMVPKFAKPRMDTCVQCHIQRGQTTACTKCHSAIGIPDNHKNQAAWKVSHGVTARADIKSCDSCHSYGFIEPVSTKQMTVGEYARTNEFCLDCHTKRPENHGAKEQETWISTHKTVAKSKGIENCIACHDTKPEAKPAVKPVEAKPPDADGKHGEGKKDEIDRMVTNRSKEDMVNKVTCSQCHGMKKF